MPLRNIRNNNPGNIRLVPANNWEGRVPPDQNTDGAFEQFNTPEDGWRALFVLLRGRGYIGGGRDTIREIISRWAPPFENDTELYIRQMVEAVGIPADQRIDPNDAEVLQKLAWAIARKEGYDGAGGDFDSRFTPEVVAGAWQRATGGGSRGVSDGVAEQAADLAALGQIDEPTPEELAVFDGFIPAPSDTDSDDDSGDSGDSSGSGGSGDGGGTQEPQVVQKPDHDYGSFSVNIWGDQWDRDNINFALFRDEEIVDPQGNVVNLMDYLLDNEITDEELIAKWVSETR